METLADRIARDGPVNELDAIGWAIRLAKRLEALHALGVAHGSVSPACILTAGQDRNARAYLADVQHTTATPTYQSPERILGGDISIADDVWALAGTLYALLTGQAPFAGATDHEIKQRIFAASPAPLAVYDIGDDDLQHIIDRAFLRDSNVRTSNIAALRRSLEEWHPDRSVTNLPPLEDEDSTNDDDDVARTVMVRDASAFLNQLGPGPGPAVPKVNADTDDDDDDNVRTVMRSMPTDDLASMIAKARAATPPAGPHPGPRAPSVPGVPHAPPAAPYAGNNAGTMAMAPQLPSPGGPPPAPPGIFPRAGVPAPQPPMARGSNPGFPAPHAPPRPAFPHPPQPPPFGAAPRPAPPFGGPPQPPAAALPRPNDDDDDDDDDDDNARTMMRSPEAMLAALDAPKAPPDRTPFPGSGAFSAPQPHPPQPPAAAPAAWNRGGPAADNNPAPAPTMALPAFEDGPPDPHFGRPDPQLGGGTQPMGGPQMDAMAGLLATRPIAPLEPPSPNMGAPNMGAPNMGPPNFGAPNMGPPNFGAPNFGAPNMGPPNMGPPNMGPPNMGPPNFGAPNMGELAAPGDLSALEGPGAPQGGPMAFGAPGMPGAPGIDINAALAPEPSRTSKALLIVAALVALLIAAGVTFLILRSRAG